MATSRNVVEIHKNGGNPLTAVGAEGASSICVRIHAVIVLNVALAVRVSCNLRQLHVPKGFVGQLLDFLEQDWTRMRFLRKVASKARTAFGGLATCKGMRSGAQKTS